tara:strand:+ start:41801 stop:41962 length:162 start_codon:yes stop_codon:yes gene_type:complete
MLPPEPGSRSPFSEPAPTILAGRTFAAADESISDKLNLNAAVAQLAEQRIRNA